MDEEKSRSRSSPTRTVASSMKSDPKASSEGDASTPRDGGASRSQQGEEGGGKDANATVASDALGGAKILFLSSVFHKLCTFTLNQLMIRYSSPELFGLVSVELELILTSLLFLSREGIRLASLQSRGSDEDDRFGLVRDVSAAPVLATAIMSVMILTFYWTSRPSVPIEVVAMYCAGSILEVLAEPFYNVFNSRLDLVPRMRADSAAITLRSALTFFFVVVMGIGARGFAISQLAYGITFLLIMAWHAPRTQVGGRACSASDYLRGFKSIPELLSSLVTSVSSRKKSGSHISPKERLLQLAVHMTGSSLLKHLLTEGDKIILTLASTHFNQGIYAITSNYGSLVARIIFMPIEETSKLAFSRIGSSGSPKYDILTHIKSSFSLFSEPSESLTELVPSLADDASKDNADGATASNTSKSSKVARAVVQARPQLTGEALLSVVDEAEEAMAKLNSMADIFAIILQGMILFSLIFPVVGIHYARVAVKLLLGHRWYQEDTVNTLAAYCLYLFVMSVNGVSESFVHSVISPKSLRSFNMNLIFSWLLFSAIAVPLLRTYGTAGLVVANAIAMTFRASWNLYFTQRFVGFGSAYCQRIIKLASHGSVLDSSRKAKKSCPVVSKSNASAATGDSFFCAFAYIFPQIQICIFYVLITAVLYKSAHAYALIPHPDEGHQQLLRHLGVGVCGGLAYLFVTWLYGRSALRDFYDFVIKKQKQKEHSD